MAVSPCRTPTWWRSGCSHPTTCRSTSFLEAVSSDLSEFVDARVGPRGSLENLSQSEIGKLLDTGQGGLYPLFRRCALAVLNSGAPTDNAKEIFDRYRDFDIRIVRHPWGVKLEVQNAPAAAFVDGEMIRGIKEHLFAVLRDVVFISNEIIAAEPPNPIVSQLAIMPDIEKRLEAFVRLGHGIVVFPGGAGTAEEILYLTGILLDPANREQPFPIVLTGPRDSAAYFEQITRFISGTLGSEAVRRLVTIIDDPPEVARRLVRGMDAVREFRRHRSDSYNFNWLLSIQPQFQQPFEVTHAAMRALALKREQPAH